jgi:hypothetical protein
VQTWSLSESGVEKHVTSRVDTRTFWVRAIVDETDGSHEFLCARIESVGSYVTIEICSPVPPMDQRPHFRDVLEWEGTNPKTARNVNREVTYRVLLRDKGLSLKQAREIVRKRTGPGKAPLPV